VINMGLLARLQPRDADLAARVLATLALVAGGVTVVFAAVQPGKQGATSLSVLLTAFSAAAVVAVALLLRRMRSSSPWAWALFPFAAVSMIVFLDLFTGDATASAQVFFLFPALYGGFTLRRAGAVLVGSAAIIGDLVDVLTLLPVRLAIVQGGYLVAAVATTVALLVMSGERQDALVAELRTQAAVDSLTGLVTRRVLDEAASSALSGAASEQGTGLLLLDIDHFKRINDEHGHPAGDEVLVQVSKLLLQNSRASDTVSRMGGDEIAVLLAGCSVEALQQRAEQILLEMRGCPFTTEAGASLSLTVSIGIAHLPTHGSNLRSLYGAADTSLYIAKRAGRDQVGPMPDTVRPVRSAAA
jgi:diguanylate cyclase (GGDEF)-like protein